MTDQSQNNKRIAKNTMMLYIRMLIIMGVTLYTSRVVLDQLGVVDYGVYNVVAGIIVLFSFLTSSLQLASQRYFSYELEPSNVNSNITAVFKSSFRLHFIFSLLFVLVCQTVGLWLLIYKLNIPVDRKNVAIWVFEISIFTGIVSIFRVPYNALIIAYEKLSVFAKYSVVEAALKIITIVVLIYMKSDKLILYTILVAVCTIIVNGLYMFYCHRYLLTDFMRTNPNKGIMKEMLSFSSWMLMLGVANVSATQGINFILNIAYGVIINAAIGVANQVNAAVNQFVSNFQTSFNPQLIKSYASSSFNQLFSLLFNGSRLSFFLLLALSWPIIVNIDFILNIWLKDVPQYSNTIVIWILVYALVDVFVNPIAIVVHATGQIKRYQLYASIFILSIIPLCFICIYFELPPPTIFLLRAIINFCSLLWRIYYLRKSINMNIKDYMIQVFKPCSKILVVSVILFMLVNCVDLQSARVFISLILWAFAMIPAIYFVGLKDSERFFIKSIIKKIIYG